MTPHFTTDKKGVGVAVDATDAVLDAVELKSGATGVEWQVANDDITQVLSCRVQVRAGSTADWVDVEFAEELGAVGPGESKRAMWRFVTGEMRLVGTADGAGLDARLWRNTLYGVQP